MHTSYANINLDTQAHVFVSVSRATCAGWFAPRMGVETRATCMGPHRNKYPSPLHYCYSGVDGLQLLRTLTCNVQTCAMCI